MIGDLAVGSPIVDAASKETRNLPSSIDLLVPESRSPVLLFFGSLKISSASFFFSSCEATCRMPESAHKGQASVNELKKKCKLVEQTEKAARSAKSLLFLLATVK